MPTRKASAEWKGDLKSGQGHLRLGSGLFDADYGFGNRFGEEPGTNPEELIGAALAACYSMALSAELGKAGFTPEEIHTEASVEIAKQGDGFAVTRIDLDVKASVLDMNENKFDQIAQTVRKQCPVAKALAGTTIHLKSALQ